jgi:hypothetical protein
MDIKEATKAAAPRYAHAKMPTDNAMRSKQHLPPIWRTHAATRFQDRAIFIRELLPQDLKLR